MYVVDCSDIKGGWLQLLNVGIGVLRYVLVLIVFFAFFGQDNCFLEK